jgi:hypothetical protein
MEKKLFLPHYDQSFKRKVIEEYLATGCTKMFLLRKYNIQFKSAIQTWMRILGYKDTNPEPQKFKFGEIIFSSLPKDKKHSDTDSAKLQKKSLKFQLKKSQVPGNP